MALQLFVDIATGRFWTTATVLRFSVTQEKNGEHPRKSGKVHAEEHSSCGMEEPLQDEAVATMEASDESELDSNVEADAVPSLGNSLLAYATEQACEQVREEGLNTTWDCVNEIKQTADVCKQSLTSLTASTQLQLNDLEDILMFHSEVDYEVAREICEKIEDALKPDINPSIELYANFAIGRSHINSIDVVFDQFRWVLFLVTPEYVHNGLQNFQGATMLHSLIENDGNIDGRLVPLLYKVEKKDISRKWVNGIGPVYYSRDKDFIANIAQRIRELRSKS